ncbi:MAG: RagB/SusD family nutrient uptake outer membrane protein [Pyrinomonadaceae bacterium]|nr:RagB/SusD family nutrient uptake outer membrane protein [Sphingobacteriaceae bacterium]
MKKIFLILTISSFLLPSCKKTFLTLAPQSQVTDATFYTSTTDITNAVSAAYASLRDNQMYNRDFITLMELRSDNVEDQNPGGNAGNEYNVDRFIAKSDNVGILNAYGALYNAISRVNNTLAHLDVVTTPALKAQYEGELKFLRALHYFNIVRLWGASPLVLTPITADEAKKLTRVPAAEIYTAIENDLTSATSLLPATYTTKDLGRATAGAAKALLGKVYLTQKKYSQAVSVLKDLVPPTTNPYQYRLLPNVADVFSVTNKLNAEIIFAVHFEKTIAGHGHALPGYFNQPILDPKLLSAYQPSDTRRDLLNIVAVDANNKPVKKYYDTFDPVTRSLGNDYIILRYADVLLMYAEALNEVSYNPSVTSDAFVYLNAVRARANASVYTATDLPDQAAFREAVLKERRLELPLELNRWFDLVRTNTAINALQTSGLLPLTIQPFQFLYPLPQTEVNLMNNPSGFPQNPGYN